MDDKASRLGNQYKRYLEPNCDSSKRTIPRTTQYRKNLKLCASESEKFQASTKCGEASKESTEDARYDVEDKSVFTEVKGQEAMDDSSYENVRSNPVFLDEAEISESQGDMADSSCENVRSNSVFLDEAEISEGQEDMADGSYENSRLNEVFLDEAEISEEEDDMEDSSSENGRLNQVFPDETEISEKEAGKKENLTRDMDEDLNEEHQFTITISKRAVLTLILSFCLRFQVPDIGISFLIELINTLIGKEFVSSSLFHLWKQFNVNGENSVKTHFYCEKCYSYLGSNNENPSILCETCQIQVPTNPQSSSCFMSISLESQIKNLIHSGIINLSFVKNFNNNLNNSNDSSISDINDGKLYEELRNSTNSPFLTCNFSVDGLAVFNNAKGSLWPILVTVNEISPLERFKNVLLAGLWFGKKEPKMDLYLHPFVEESIKLAQQGISLNSESPETLKVFLACCCADSVARPCIQNMIQFNGYYGCCWCQHPGFTVNNTVKYIYKDTLLYPDRTERETIKLMHLAIKNGKSVQGVKGPSVLLPVPHFDIILNFVPDYMHGIFLGVAKCIINSWFDSKNNSQVFYIGSSRVMSVIDDRLSRVVFPHNVGRVPRSIHERNLYKATEWKNFLLYMCIPCLKGILPHSYLDHISLLVGAVNYLSRKSITPDKLQVADALLMKFVSQVQVLYGEGFMTFNMHLLLHYVGSVINWGPLWCHSMFVYEGYNAVLQSFIMGTRGIRTQSLKRFLLVQKLRTDNSLPSSVSNYINKLNLKSKVHKKILRVDNCELYGLANIQIQSVCSESLPADFFKIYLVESSDIRYYKRMTVENMLFTVKPNKQSRTRNDFIYTKSLVGKIIFIALHCSISKVKICVNKFDVMYNSYTSVNNMCVVKNSGTYHLIDPTEIVGKCTEYVDIDGSITIFKVPVTNELST